jgi:hypothetical protein
MDCMEKDYGRLTPDDATWLLDGLGLQVCKILCPDINGVNMPT